MSQQHTPGPWEVTVSLPHPYNGTQDYLVRRDEAGAIAVFAIVKRKPVSARGFYQADEVYRTIKPGSRNYRAALAKAEPAQ